MVSSYKKRGVNQQFWETIVRQAVLKRDKYRCVECKSKKNLEIHEEDPNNITINTLRTLCHKCHRTIKSKKTIFTCIKKFIIKSYNLIFN